MKRLSFTTITLLASLAFISFSQDCNNPLLGFFGLPGLDAPQSGADLPYCAGLQAADTCCSADTVASFQDRLNGLVDNLNNYAAGRDLYLAQLRNSYLDRFNDILEDIREDHQNDLQTIREGNATLADELENIINNARQLSNDSSTVNNQFVANLDEYQRARSECFTTALEVHTSAWCSACDPNYATQGVSPNGVVTFSEGLCQAISDACSPYFNQSADFNPLFAARAAYWNLSAVGRYLNNYTTNGVLNAFTIPQDPYNPLNTQQPVTVPEAWIGNGEAGSAAQCQDFWSGDAQLAGLLNIGTAEGTESEAARLLQDGGVWGPDLTATGLDFSGVRLDAGDYFGVSDYSDNLDQNQNDWDPTDNNDQTDNNDNNDLTDNDNNNDPTDNDDDNDNDDNNDLTDNNDDNNDPTDNDD